MVQKGRSNGFLKGTSGLGKLFLFPFPLFIEIFYIKINVAFKPQEIFRMCEELFWPFAV